METKFPNYKILQWNKEDIRDKEEITTKQKEGYFDTGGNKKSDDKLDDYEAKITELNGYFT